MNNKRNDRKTGTGRFAKGVSGNPAGRPLGSRNRATLLMEELLAGEVEPLVQKVIELAKDGHFNAIRLCLDRILPARKDRPIHLDLPPITNAQELSAALSTVIEAVAAGRLTPSEGEILSNILGVKTQVIANGDLERRIEQLEQAGSNSKNAKAGSEAELTDQLREGRGQMVEPKP